MIVRQGTAKMLKDEFQIPLDVTEIMFNTGFLIEQKCRDVLIRDEYKRKAQPKEKNRLKGKLAEKYCVSIFLVEKIVGNKCISL
jgi:hypothetical protein